jgi:hypothetical protein
MLEGLRQRTGPNIIWSNTKKFPLEYTIDYWQVANLGTGTYILILIAASWLEKWLPYGTRKFSFSYKSDMFDCVLLIIYFYDLYM